MSTRNLDAPPWSVQTEFSSTDESQAFSVYNPATGAELARVAGGGRKEADAAVKRAHEAFLEWRYVPVQERCKALLRVADLVEAHADEIAQLETMEMGKPFRQSRELDLEFCIGAFRFFGGLADKLPSEYIAHDPISVYTLREPYGVIGGVLPFNWPPIHTAGKSAPALATGNTVVIKPPLQAPLAIMRIVELMQEILPPGAIEVVPGGVDAGAAIAANPLVGKLSFTGSTPAGRAVLKTAADNLTPALLELGGKNALIVFDDADLDLALRGAIEGAFFNQGEACTAASRILLADEIYDEFAERFAAATERMIVGDGMDRETHVGPLVTREHQERVQEYLRIGAEEGAKVLGRASVPRDPRLKDGYWVAPTVFGGVDRSMRIAREEIFGPVTALMRFSSYEEAIEIANDTEFGLVAGVYSRDFAKTQRTVRDLAVGVVMVNNYNRAFLGTPFGGTKGTGYGREHAVETLREFTRTKAVRMTSGLSEIPIWHGAEEVLG